MDQFTAFPEIVIDDLTHNVPAMVTDSTPCEEADYQDTLPVDEDSHWGRGGTYCVIA